MGEAKRKLKAFIQKHPTCCFCARHKTETRDHVPPKSVFLKKQFPEGFIFPACKLCNEGTSSYDQIFSILNLVFGFPDNDMPKVDRERAFRGIIHHCPKELRESLTNFFTNCKDFDKETGWPAFQINTDLKIILNRIARKIAKALYYKYNGNALSEFSILTSIIISNNQFNSDSVQRLFGLFDVSNMPKFNNEYSPQFIYCISKISNKNAFAILFQIHKACAFLCVVSEDGIKIAAKAQLDWYDMQEQLI